MSSDAKKCVEEKIEDEQPKKGFFKNLIDKLKKVFGFLKLEKEGK